MGIYCQKCISDLIQNEGDVTIENKKPIQVVGSKQEENNHKNYQNNIEITKNIEFSISYSLNICKTNNEFNKNNKKESLTNDTQNPKIYNNNLINKNEYNSINDNKFEEEKNEFINNDNNNNFEDKKESNISNDEFFIEDKNSSKENLINYIHFADKEEISKDESLFDNNYKEIDFNFSHFQISNIELIEKKSNENYKNDNNILESEIDKLNNIKNKEKNEIKLIFFDEKKNKNYPLIINLSKSDKFYIIAGQLYEKYPEFEENEIKNYFYNDKKIKKTQNVEEIGFNDLSKILIELY